LGRVGDSQLWSIFGNASAAAGAEIFLVLIHRPLGIQASISSSYLGVFSDRHLASFLRNF
jgi:hypothetical protein